MQLGHVFLNLENKEYHFKELPKTFHFNGHYYAMDISVIELPFRTLSMTYSASEMVNFRVIRRRAKQGINAFQLPYVKILGVDKLSFFLAPR